MDISSLEAAIKLLAEKITDESKPVDALQYTQAALNLAHAIITLKTPTL